VPSSYGQMLFEGNKLVFFMKGYEQSENEANVKNYASALAYNVFIRGVFDATHHMYYNINNVEPQQLCAVVTKYLKAHPERWNEPAVKLVIDALKEAFPKKQ